MAEIEDPGERVARIRSLGYAITDEEIMSTFARPLPPPSFCSEEPISETLWEEKQPTFECRAAYAGDSSALLSVNGDFDGTAAPSGANSWTVAHEGRRAALGTAGLESVCVNI